VSPDQFVLLVCAFAAGVLVTDVAHEIRDKADCAPTESSVPAEVQAKVCAHYMAVGQGWKCQ
jgi:hypothetical protein